MPPAGFEPTILAGKWSQNYASDQAATGIGSSTEILRTIICLVRHSPFVMREREAIQCPRDAGGWVAGGTAFQGNG